MEAAQKAKVHIEDFSDLGDELTKYVGALKLERKAKKEISHFIGQFLSMMSQPVPLDPKRLSEWIPGIDSAVLVEGEKLVVKKGEREYQISVLTLPPDPYLEVVKEAAAVVAKLLAEEDARQAAKIKPNLQVFLRMIGGRLAVFDWRNCMLVLANTGGAAKKVTLSLSTADKETYGPIDINALENTEIELRHLYRILNTKNLKVVAKCEDAEGRQYSGEIEIEPNTKSVRIFTLGASGR